MKTGQNIRLRADGRYEARYMKNRDDSGKIVYGYCYGKTFEEAAEKRERAQGKPSFTPEKVKRMNLLILGAGGQGLVVKEVAQSIGIFNKIAFLDDNTKKPHTIGKCNDCKSFLSEYPIAIPSVGNNFLRIQWIEMLANAGFIIPKLIHPTATVSPSAVIEYGTLVEPKATIGANAKIGIGCIISTGAIVDRDTVIPNGCRISCGVTVMFGIEIPECSGIGMNR